MCMCVDVCVCVCVYFLAPPRCSGYPGHGWSPWRRTPHTPCVRVRKGRDTHDCVRRCGGVPVWSRADVAVGARSEACALRSGEWATGCTHGSKHGPPHTRTHTDGLCEPSDTHVNPVAAPYSAHMRLSASRAAWRGYRIRLWRVGWWLSDGSWWLVGGSLGGSVHVPRMCTEATLHFRLGATRSTPLIPPLIPTPPGALFPTTRPLAHSHPPGRPQTTDPMPAPAAPTPEALQRDAHFITLAF